MRWFRMNPTSDEVSKLLSEEGQWTEPWGSSDDGARCDKCAGRRRIEHECWSCELAGPQSSCPVCRGEVRWEAICPVCRGSAKVDGRPRHGVSVFPRAEGLYHYMVTKGADLDGCLIVELEGERAQDVDFDADQGAVLVLPTAIVGCSRADRELAERVRGAADAERH